MKNIGEFIKIRRKELNLTLKDVANKLNVTESLVSRYENGEVKNMGIDKLIPLSEILEVDVNRIINFLKENKKVFNKKENILNRINQLLKQNYLAISSIAELEKIAELSNGSIRNWDKSFPSIDKFYRVSKILGCSMDYLLNGEKLEMDIRNMQLKEINDIISQLDLKNLAEVYNFVRVMDRIYKKEQKKG